MGFQISEFEFQTFLFVFYPPLFGTLFQIFPFLNHDASPKIFNTTEVCLFIWFLELKCPIVVMESHIISNLPDQICLLSSPP